MIFTVGSQLTWAFDSVGLLWAAPPKPQTSVVTLTFYSQNRSALPMGSANKEYGTDPPVVPNGVISLSSCPREAGRFVEIPCLSCAVAESTLVRSDDDQRRALPTLLASFPTYLQSQKYGKGRPWPGEVIRYPLAWPHHGR